MPAGRRLPVPEPPEAPAEALPPEAPPPPEPPLWYEATANLYIYNPESGVMPLLAYVPGARVDPDVVAANGWQHLVRVPDIFAGQHAQPAADAAGEES